MLKQVVLDTETTGFEPKEGHRIVEIGAIELIDGVKTGKIYHQYINPQMHIPEEVVKVHGITDEKVKDCPTFEQIADEFLEFIKGAELVIHNAEFDIKFLNSEISKANKGDLWKYATNSIDTLDVSRKVNAGDRKHSLDALCAKYGVDNSNREFHGALLDSELLAEVYVHLTGGISADEVQSVIEQTNWVRPEIKRYNNPQLKVISVSETDEALHQETLGKLTDPVWNKKTAPQI